MSEAVEGLTRVGADRHAGRLSSAKAAYRHLVWIYLLGSFAAVTVTLLLALLGLEFTAAQWAGLLAATPLAVVIYLVPDIYVIGRHYRPVGRALERLDRGERPSEEEASAALARALNLPFYSFVRITFVHGPMAALASVVAMTALNLVADAGIERWQILTFAATALFFASPTH